MVDVIHHHTVNTDDHDTFYFVFLQMSAGGTDESTGECTTNLCDTGSDNIVQKRKVAKIRPRVFFFFVIKLLVSPVFKIHDNKRTH